MQSPAAHQIHLPAG